MSRSRGKRQGLLADETPQETSRVKGTGNGRAILFGLMGALLGLLICLAGLGVGYAVGRMHADVLAVNVEQQFVVPTISDSPPIPGLPEDLPFIVIPDYGIGFTCGAWSELDVEEAQAFVGVTLDDARDGPEIFEVVDGGPADEAGLQGGDIILEMDGERVRDAEDLHSLLGDYEPCDEVEIILLRGDDELSIEVTLGGVVLTE